MAIRNRLAFDAGLLLDSKHAPHVLNQRQGAIYAEHVAALNSYVDRMRQETDESIPYFDPLSGGVRAGVLILLQDPSAVASEGSGFISRHNNDTTARNTMLACEESSLAYENCVHWNVVPWWVDNPARPGKRSMRDEAERALPYTRELLMLLPKLRVLLLAGRVAHRGWAAATVADRTGALRSIPMITCPHPGAQAWNNQDKVTGRRNSELTIEAFRAARELALPT